MRKNNLTLYDLKDQLHYDGDKGIFTRKKSFSNRVRAGDVAGTKRKDNGYVTIRICGEIHRAHRLAWLYIYGEFPKQQIDHINGNRSDNRICNLREVTQAQNSQNQYRARTDGGLIGAFIHKETGKWCSQIEVKYKKIHLGLFNTKEEAHKAYLLAKAELHPFGEIAKQNIDGIIGELK